MTHFANCPACQARHRLIVIEESLRLAREAPVDPPTRQVRAVTGSRS